MQDPILFALAIIAILGVPGPTNTLLATAGATSGARAAMLLIPFEGLAYLVSVVAWGKMIGPIVARLPVLDIGIRVLLGAYLLYAAWKLWSPRPHDRSDRPPPISRARIFLVTLLNPKGAVIALAIIPFGSSDAWRYIIGFNCLAAAIACGWIGVGIGLGGAARATGQARLIPQAAATALAAFSAILIASPFVR